MQTPPTPPVSNSSITGQAAPPVTANAATSSATTSLPASSPLSSLNNGSVIEGFVLNRGGDGSVTLRTAQGDVTLKSDVFMKTGAQLTLRVDSTGGKSGATILTIDARPFNLVAAEQRGESQPVRDGVQLSPQSQPLASSASTASGDAAKMITLPAMQAAILETTPEGKQQLRQFAAMLGLQSFPEESNLQLRVKLALSQTTQQAPLQNAPQHPNNSSSGSVQINQAPPNATNTASTAGTAGTTASTAQSHASAATTAATGGTPQNQAADDLPPQLARFSSPAPQTTEPPKNAAAGAQTAMPLPDETGAKQHRVASNSAHQEYAQLTRTEHSPQLQSGANRVHLQVTHQLPEGSPPLRLTGEMTGHDAKGNSIVKTPIGSLSVPISPAPEKGAQIQLEVIGISVPNLANTSAGQSPLAQPGKTPGLDALLAHLTKSSSTASSHTAPPAQSPLPKIGPTFTQDMLFLLTAIKGGSAEQWLGRENLRALKQLGGDELVNQTRAEFGAIRAAANLPPDESQWQSYNFPFIVKEELQQGQLHYKKEEKETEQGREEFTRFIVEVSMSVFGLLQLDGLVMKNAAPDVAPKMDVAVRTGAPLPITMREDIMELYSHAAEFGNFQGTVKFYAGENVFFELPRAEEPTIRSRKNQDGIVT